MSPFSPRFFTTSLLPVYERLVLKGGHWRKIDLRVRVGYFHHQTLGHSLIDTGYFNASTLRRIRVSPLLSVYRALLRPSTLANDPLSANLARLGIDRQQIQTILITHFHADHIGRLHDFPDAEVICSRKAWTSYARNSRIRNAVSGIFDVLLPGDLEERLRFFEDFPVVAAPNGLGSGYNLLEDGSLLAIDLPGHAQGHIGFCFPQLPDPLLYATDSQWLIKAILEHRAPGFPASLVAADGQALRSSMKRVEGFARRGGVVMLCHDSNNHRYDLDTDLGARS
ncbi:MBL fold metallo-hydrolase (plasmid) [Rhizobium sp. NIBRBAC000502774]|nr:MBL fold metallo-hydrolase [Rhizobium sp. NIBRBAC000502774]